MTNDERRDFLKAYFQSDLSRNDLQDNKIAVLQARARECENFPDLVRELMGNSRFATQYANVHPAGWRQHRYGDTRTPTQRMTEDQLRATGRRPGSEQRGFSPLQGDQKPRATFGSADLSPVKKQQPVGPIASTQSCRAAGLPEGSSVVEVMAALEKS
jgi:hypothetical protein